MSEAPPLWRTPEHANLAALEEAWGAHRLSQILAAALDSYNRLGNVSAGTAAAALGVSEGTIRRWIRDGVPAGRRQAVISLVRPPQGAFENEYSALLRARHDLQLAEEDPATAEALWGAKGWLEPHHLAIVKIANEPVTVARVARRTRNAAATRNMLKGGEKDERGHYLPPVEIAPFRSYFAANIARLELLEDVYPYRVQLADGKLERGASKAWLAEAPRKPLDSYRRRPRKRSRPTGAVGIRPEQPV